MNYRQLNGITIRAGFEKFNSENPHIFEEFEKQALIAIDKGKSKISAKHIINFIRWNEFLKTTDKNFKINDAYQSYYARFFIEKYPQYSNLFEMRKLRNEEAGPYMDVDENSNVNFL